MGPIKKPKWLEIKPNVSYIGMAKNGAKLLIK